MKKSEFKKAIKEEIIDILEADAEDIKAQQDLNKELELSKTHADDLGDALSEDNDQDDGYVQHKYGDIGKAYDAIVNRDKQDIPGKPAFVKEEDDEPKAKDLKGEPLSKIGYKLADTQKEMKRVVKKYSAAEGDEKEKLKDRLRELNKIKKELESLLESKR